MLFLTCTRSDCVYVEPKQVQRHSVDFRKASITLLSHVVARLIQTKIETGQLLPISFYEADVRFRSFLLFTRKLTFPAKTAGLKITSLEKSHIKPG